MNVCVCDNEERQCGVGTGVNATMLFTTLQVVGLERSSQLLLFVMNREILYMSVGVMKD
jgi:hypothetical protein